MADDHEGTIPDLLEALERSLAERSSRPCAQCGWPREDMIINYDGSRCSNCGAWYYRQNATNPGEADG